MAEIPEWTAALLKGEFEPMRALVRELAEMDPNLASEKCNSCRLCDAPEGFTHEPTCLWLRARKLAGLM